MEFDDDLHQQLCDLHQQLCNLHQQLCDLITEHVCNGELRKLSRKYIRAHNGVEICTTNQQFQALLLSNDKDVARGELSSFFNEGDCNTIIKLIYGEEPSAKKQRC
jgi:regulator of replication initiation timing